MPVRTSLAIIAGGVLTTAIALVSAEATDTEIAQRLSAAAETAIAEASGQGVTAEFVAPEGSPSRHPRLSGGERLAEDVRAKVARAVAGIPGVGGVRWADGTAIAESGDIPITPLHCQEDVEALLKARTIRFEESSAEIDPASRGLLDEVAAALRPCLGSVIAVIGHTDSSGSEPANLALSQQRAAAVEAALIERGIPGGGLRSRGVGSAEPVEGLDPADPANRRIEFSVVAKMPLKPTPVDTPSAR